LEVQERVAGRDFGVAVNGGLGGCFRFLLASVCLGAEHGAASGGRRRKGREEEREEERRKDGRRVRCQMIGRDDDWMGQSKRRPQRHQNPPVWPSPLRALA
jgi:hypothetical protein